MIPWWEDKARIGVGTQSNMRGHRPVEVRHAHGMKRGQSMSKKKGHGRVRHGALAAYGPSPMSQLAQAQVLLDQGSLNEASQLLEPLANRPGMQEVALRMLSTVYTELGDRVRILHACERLQHIAPNDPDVHLALTEAYVNNARMILALRSGRSFLERWPQSEDADDMRTLVGAMEVELRSIAAEVGLSEEDTVEVFTLHEQALCRTEQLQFSEARLLEERALRRKPDFTPALNTISQCYAAEGELPRAIAYAQRVVESDPDNIHALGNLVRYLYTAGQAAEAAPYAERLKAIPITEQEVWVKQSEVLSFLGDDEGVLAAFREAERQHWLKAPLFYPIAVHMAAVSAWRLGDEKEARRIWQRLAQLDPQLEIARANQTDLKKPVGERHAPWSLTISDWLPVEYATDLKQLASSALAEAATPPPARVMRQFVARHPGIIGVIPHLLDRGDPIGRTLAMFIARGVATPEMLAALRDFALSQRGPDSMRLEAANTALEAGLIAAGPTRLWIGGEWTEMILMNIEVTDEQMTYHSSEIEEWANDAVVALRDREGARAEALLKRALEIEPDAPNLQNNLAFAYEIQGRADEAYALTQQIYERHPDYFFGRVGMAGLAMRRGAYEEAKALLNPLLSRRKMHITEWRGLCSAEMDLALAEGNVDGARSWLSMWEKVEPDNPLLASWRRRLEVHGLLRPGGRRIVRRR